MRNRLFLSALAALGVVIAQSADPGGNAMLKGKFQFREVAILGFDSAGSPTETSAAYGIITFDGNGRYLVSGTYVDNIISSGAPQTLAAYGSYSLSSAGLGTLSDPLNASDPTSMIYGAVGQGIFAGSSTEGNVNNIFIAIPAGGGFDPSVGYSAAVLDIGARTGSLLQVSAGVAGGRTVVTSADGKFALGWTPGGYDVLFGVQSGSTAETMFHGLYSMAGLEYTPHGTDRCGAVDSYYGSAISDGAGSQIVHQRLASPYCYVVDFESDDHMRISGGQYAFSPDGSAFVGVGAAGKLSLRVGVRANDFNGTGVFLNPIGVANAASLAPLTMSIAPGELITLYGGGLSSETKTMQGGQAFPTTLAGVQVLINAMAAPIYYVSPSQISVIVPYSVQNASGKAAIQVINNGVASNTISVFVSSTAPGIFTQSSNGLGYAAAVHASDGSLVTAANPAIPGEYLAIFLTGLGSVTPMSSNSTTNATPLDAADVYVGNHLSIYIDDYANAVFSKAKVTYAGLAPGLAGLYQVNLQVPNAIGPGDVYLEIVTDSADVNQAMIPVGSK